MVQQINAFAAKPGHLTAIIGIDMVEGEGRLPKVVL